VGPTAAGCGPHSLAITALALEPVPDTGADSASRYGPAQAGRATRAERARQVSAVEPQEFVTVRCASGVFSGAVKCTGLDRVSAVLEPLDSALGVVDLQYSFDLADGVVLLEPA
jgi:hypothetical protein